MKNIIYAILVVSVLASCKSKKNISRRKPVKVVKVKNKKATNTVVKTDKTTIKNSAYVKDKKPEDLANVETKTSFDRNLVDLLYDGKMSLNKDKVAYIKKYSEIAIHEMENYKIPASITLAQGLLESRYGKSMLTIKAKNHFGIKCHKWQGDRVYQDDDEKGECFRKYDFHESSFRDHSLFLAQKKRYAKLFQLHPKDYKGWARGLRTAGYATDKKYPQKLISLIEKYELYYFDNLVLGKDFEPIPEESPKQEKEVIVDNSKIHIVNAGETLYAISRKYNIPVEKLKVYNSLVSNDISVGQELKLTNLKIMNPTLVEKNNQIYQVQKGDTVYSITKKFNIATDWLVKKNNIINNTLSIGQLLIVK